MINVGPQNFCYGWPPPQPPVDKFAGLTAHGVDNWSSTVRVNECFGACGVRAVCAMESRQRALRSACGAFTKCVCVPTSRSTERPTKCVWSALRSAHEVCAKCVTKCVSKCESNTCRSVCVSKRVPIVIVCVCECVCECVKCCV